MGSNVALFFRKNLDAFGDNPDDSSDFSSSDSTRDERNFKSTKIPDNILESDLYEDDVHDQSTFLLYSDIIVKIEN